MRLHRFVTLSVSAVAVGGLLAAPTAFGTTSGSAKPVPPVAAAIGHVAYLTKAGAVDVAAVAANGSVSAVTQVGPVTAAKPKQTVTVADLMASGDGKWLAWSEQAIIQKPFSVKNLLVVRRQSGGHIIHLATGQQPVGFAGDRLVTENGVSTKRLVLTPSPHLVRIHESNTAFALAAYSHGVVDDNSTLAPAGPRRTDHLRLTTFAGTHHVLHTYVLGSTNYRDVDAAWVSADGAHVVVERGNHQDFGGLGPSSLADEYGLAGAHVRHQLGHYGTAAGQWRIASVSFAGPSDSVWAVWERGTRTGATSLVAHRAHGRWTLVTRRGIAVAGDAAGYVISQPGRFRLVGPDGIPTAVPTGHALLVHGATTKPLGASGSAFVWVRG